MSGHFNFVSYRMAMQGLFLECSGVDWVDYKPYLTRLRQWPPAFHVDVMRRCAKNCVFVTNPDRT